MTSLLLPLETLPGWPPAEHYSALYMLTLMVIGPIAVSLVVAAITFTPKLLSRSRRDAGEPVAMVPADKH